MKDREKELRELIYLRSELIKQAKKEIKEFHQELDMYYGEKKLVKQMQKNTHNKRQH